MKFLWTTIYVKNLDESIAFYTDLVGLKVMNRFTARPGMELAFLGNGTDNETQVELIADISKTGINYGEFITIGFAVDSADAMMNTAKSNNIPVHSGPFETPKFKYFCIKDPNGLNIQFFQQK
jgi:lactoylglutathione lyase